LHFRETRAPEAQWLLAPRFSVEEGAAIASSPVGTALTQRPNRHSRDDRFCEAASFRSTHAQSRRLVSDNPVIDLA
jgi:hypothetical protein